MRRVERHEWLRWVIVGLIVAAVAAGVVDGLHERDVLRGPATAFALAALWVCITRETTPRAKLTYTRATHTISQYATTVPESGLWCLQIRNVGTTPASVDAMTYYGELTDGRSVCSNEALDLHDLVVAAAGNQFHPDKDFGVFRVGSAGFTPGDNTAIFEMPLALASRFTRLGVVVTYSGPFGERTTLTAESIPNFGLRQVDDTPSDAETRAANG